MKSNYFDRLQGWLSEWDDNKTRHLLMVVLGVLVGLLIGLMVDALMHRVGDFIFPPPPVFNIADKAQLKLLLATMPIEAYFIKIVSWIIGSLVGAYVSVRMTKIGEFVAWFTGILLLASYFIGMLGIPHPIWVWLVCPFIVAGAAFGAGRLGDFVNAGRLKT